MTRRIAIIQGHPDPQGNHFGNALADEYLRSATKAGHQVQLIPVAELGFPVLRTKEDFEHQPPPEDIIQAQETIAWAEHLIIVYPLWIGAMPALLKAFFEQVMRPGFAIDYEDGRFPRKLLGGRSARVVVTMGMPALIYRWFYRAHSLKTLERNMLGMCGIAPTKETLFGLVDSASDARRGKWLKKMGTLGRKGL